MGRLHAPISFQERTSCRCYALLLPQVLDGCPWPLPRPVFVLTSQQWGWQAADGIQSTYTLRVKVVQEGAADAIAKVSPEQCCVIH